MYQISSAFMAIVCVLAVLLASGIREALDLLAGEQAPAVSTLAGILIAAALGVAALRLLPKTGKTHAAFPPEQAPPPAAPAPHCGEELTAKLRLLAEAASQPVTLASDMARSIAFASAKADKAARTYSAWTAPLGRCGELLSDCAAALESLTQAMDRVRAQSARAASKLSVISDTAAEAQSLVAGMSTIAEQTDMLSVNASIEAEKAGEHGRGFSVVAREVRRLADTAQAGAQDVERLVARMRQAVASEVMEMDSFTRESAGGENRLEELFLAVREAARALGEVSGSLKDVEGQAGAVGPALAQAMVLSRDLEASLNELGELAASAGEAHDGLTSSQPKAKDGF